MAAKGTTELEVGGEGIAVITICNPPVNSLSIDACIEEPNTICFSEETFSYYFKPFAGKGGKFSRGFDISSFGDLHSGKIEQPKVAYISIDILTELWKEQQSHQWLQLMVFVLAED
ncbi:glyoxysomal fatty acid beta-oxidation multifunctional protein MFP-a [Hordeum vulgare]|nr:glyoxysomal fatty acid beta-oxidation multifunctional protein MFP-a [Hordeum vulgare]